VEDQWLTTADLAARMHTVPSTVRYWRHRGYGPPGTKFGRRVLYKLADVVAWEKREQASQEPPRRGRAA
jgi:hypothetical protein